MTIEDFAISAGRYSNEELKNKLLNVRNQLRKYDARFKELEEEFLQANGYSVKEFSDISSDDDMLRLYRKFLTDERVSKGYSYEMQAVKQRREVEQQIFNYILDKMNVGDAERSELLHQCDYTRFESSNSFCSNYKKVLGAFMGE